ncbi:SDR family NAD(P)-dependent oxidoreductase [Planotetraspora kaengkrachanensis]|uniref:Short-chain dehydrogenase n=1 Tax=Planotetraspora kaengkrachanensis TaxID=575193 RepID=A0A8J3PTY6_9ACTN|nr:SDR family oxidoreductase [Planotetraspora kaengkrachanensis]GIG80990.1 short-chain dehydrogenase [Planotetraspora kaengkrachanensis]
MKFAGKVVLVTGGGSGIGRAVALGFAREGALVTVAGRRAEPLDDTVKLIEAAGGDAGAITADLTRSGDAARMVDEIVRRHGGLDIAINNAGVFTAAKVADIDEDDWTRTLDGNVTGVFLSMKHEIAAMRRAGTGVIVNVASQIGTHRRVPGLGAYGAAKAAVTALSRTAALEYIREGIRINVVSPGPHDTPMSLRPGENTADRDARVKEQLPIGRVGTLDEITATVLWLASDDAGFAVGHDLVVDGGSAA